MKKASVPMPPRDPCIGLSHEECLRRRRQQARDYMDAWRIDFAQRQQAASMLGFKVGGAIGLLIVVIVLAWRILS